jgi:tetratricopeptide (TPR) repeat protein
MLGLASIAWQDGKTEQASELYYRILQSEPQNAAAQAGLIGLAGRVDPVASETRLKQLIAREPAASLYFALGNLHASQGKWAAAQQAYFQAVEADSGNPDYVFNLAVALEHIGQQKPALANYRKALDLSLTRGGGAFDQKQVIARIGQLSLAVE